MITRLVVLAAGLGTRFGGPKQFSAVGQRGEALLEYALNDARKAGIESATIVVRKSLVVPDDILRHCPTAIWECQDEDGTLRGTVHAVLAANPLAEVIVTVNGDDWYGPGAFVVAAELAENVGAGRADGGLVVYPIYRTLPPGGEPVTRALATLDDAGRLSGIQELHNVEFSGGSIRSDELSPVSPDTLVSMNLWVLGPNLVEQLRSVLGDGSLNLPDAISLCIDDGAVILTGTATDRWCGLTRAQDVDWVRERLKLEPSPRA